MSDVAISYTVHVFAVVGSLRKDSFNKKLLRAALELVPSGMMIHQFDGLADIPPYNADADVEPRPEPVRALKQMLAACDGLLVVTPEYNYGIPGVLKNAIDWASRPPATSPLLGKVALLMGAATGMVGTARAQQQLRQNFTFTKTTVLPPPEILVGKAAEKFDGDGRLIDDLAKQIIAERLKALGEWIYRLRQR
ncbi:MAG TPA: NAD(P)H-dependent oxidoreductase [Gemmatimonadaceae bacterium]|nr:NAD(P)H-dependent oxidoreductase [Gemmatimonadaceae bacterium]